MAIAQSEFGGRPTLGGWIPAVAVALACLSGASQTTSVRADEAPNAGHPPEIRANDVPGHADAPNQGHAEGPVTLHGKPRENYFGPQTEFLWWSPKLFGWTLILFLALWFVLGRLVWRPLLQAFEERDQKIVETLALAEKLRDEAKSIADTMDEDVVRAQQSARAILDQARAEAAGEVAQMMAAARQEQAETLQAARVEIDSAMRHGLAEIESAAEGIGGAIADRLAGRAIAGRTGGER